MFAALDAPPKQSGPLCIGPRSRTCSFARRPTLPSASGRQSMQRAMRGSGSTASNGWSQSTELPFAEAAGPFRRGAWEAGYSAKDRLDHFRHPHEANCETAALIFYPSMFHGSRIESWNSSQSQKAQEIRAPYPKSASTISLHALSSVIPPGNARNKYLHTWTRGTSTRRQSGGCPGRPSRFHCVLNFISTYPWSWRIGSRSSASI